MTININQHQSTAVNRDDNEGQEAGESTATSRSTTPTSTSDESDEQTESEVEESEDDNSDVIDKAVSDEVEKEKLYEVLQIYLNPIKRGYRNSSQLPLEYDTKNVRAKVKMMVRDHLYKNVKVFDESVMWNICPYEKDTLLADVMQYFEYGNKDVLWKARWWYTYRLLIRKQINIKRNDSVDAMKRKLHLGITAFKKIKISTFEKNHISNLLPFLDEDDIEHSVHDLISIKNMNAYCEFLKWCAFCTVSQVTFRKMETDGVSKTLSVYDEALALFVFQDKYMYWRDDYIESARQPDETSASDAEEESSEDSEPTDQEARTPRYTSGTTRAWGTDALKKFNELCASISGQRSLEEYEEVEKEVKRRWFEIDDTGSRKKRKALERMRLQLENRSCTSIDEPDDNVFSKEEIKKRRIVNIGSVVTKYNINFTNQSRFKQEKEARRLKILQLREKQAKLEEMKKKREEQERALERQSEEIQRTREDLEREESELVADGRSSDEEDETQQLPGITATGIAL